MREGLFYLTVLEVCSPRSGGPIDLMSDEDGGWQNTCSERCTWWSRWKEPRATIKKWGSWDKPFQRRPWEMGSKPVHRESSQLLTRDTQNTCLVDKPLPYTCSRLTKKAARLVATYSSLLETPSPNVSLWPSTFPPTLPLLDCHTRPATENYPMNLRQPIIC